MTTKTFLILVAAAALASPAMAAEPIGDSPAAVRQVHFADLNLESDAGRATLERRLDRAVKSLCAVSPVAPSQAVADEQARCEAETAAAIGDQVGAAVRANRARATRTAGL